MFFRRFCSLEHGFHLVSYHMLPVNVCTLHFQDGYLPYPESTTILAHGLDWLLPMAVPY